MVSGALEIRIAETDQDVLAIHQLLLVMGNELAIGKVNPDKTLRWIMNTVRTGAVFMAILDGHLIGTVGLAEAEFKYSDERFLGDQWLFLLPQHRNGPAWPALKEEVQKLSSEVGMRVIIKRTTRARGTIIFTPEGR